MEKAINENIIEIEGKKYKFIEAEKSICCRNCDLRKDRMCHLLHRMCISDNRKDKKEGYFKRIEETTMVNKNIMKKEELEKKLKISKDTNIHCPTLELAKQVLGIFNQLGLKWCNGIDYTSNYNWYSYKENTVYYPFEGECSSLNNARLIDYKIISAEEFIALHTVKEKYNLENYEPKGDLKGFPKEIIARMLDYQEEQGSPRDVSVFEKMRIAEKDDKGFTWDNTQEDWGFWHEVITMKNFNLFFERYPKKEYQELKNNKNMQENNKEDNSQKFKVGDKVIYFITNKIGIVREIKNHKFDYDIDIVVDYGNNDICEYEISSDIERPFLLHYRDDYNYDVIDFNNLPERQEAKRRRTEKGGEYHFLRFSLEGWFYTYATKENNDSTDNINYKSGNYFRTEAEAKIIAKKLNTYFKQLTQEGNERN